jgi:hypothetical protein
MIQMMLGPKAYGFPIGQRIGARRDYSQIVTMAEEQQFWFNFTLPVPKTVKGFDGQKSCLIMLMLFLIAPNLKRIPAFNMGGIGWKLTRAKVAGKKEKTKRVPDAGGGYPVGEVRVGFTNRCLISITVSCVDAQLELRVELDKKGEQQWAAMPSSWAATQVDKTQHQSTFTSKLVSFFSAKLVMIADFEHAAKHWVEGDSLTPYLLSDALLTFTRLFPYLLGGTSGTSLLTKSGRNILMEVADNVHTLMFLPRYRAMVSRCSRALSRIASCSTYNRQ